MHCIRVRELSKRCYVGCLLIDDHAFCTQIVKLLQAIVLLRKSATWSYLARCKGLGSASLCALSCPFSNTYNVLKIATLSVDIAHAGFSSVIGYNQFQKPSSLKRRGAVAGSPNKGSSMLSYRLN
jgi:hypothetical protein